MKQCSICSAAVLAKGLCSKHYNDQWRAANRDKAAAKSAKWRKENRAKALAAQRAWRESHPEWEESYRYAPERRRQLSLKYAKAHPETVNAKNAKRHANKVSATPPWADLNKIAEYYRLARSLTALTGIKHHVDHIIPLRGAAVSGLHVENNLRVIPAVDNIKKKNHWQPQEFSG